jgi:hypothetical protein
MEESGMTQNLTRNPSRPPAARPRRRADTRRNRERLLAAARDANDMRGWTNRLRPHDPSQVVELFRGHVPRGSMVVMLEDGAEAEHARSALKAARFPDRDLVVYPAQQILRAHEAFLARRRLPQKLVGLLADDADVRDRYLGYARSGRSALWVKAANDAEANRALRVLADYRWLHVWYRNHDSQYEINAR